MNTKTILKQINLTNSLLKNNKKIINKYLKSNKNPFEERLCFYKQIPEEFKNKEKTIIPKKKYPNSYYFRDLMVEFLDLRKYEKITFERYFDFHEKDIESKIEEHGFDANISEEDFLKLFPRITFWGNAFSYNTYQIFLLAREEWVKNNLGYFIHDW